MLQEERRGADFYLFDLDHFVIMVGGAYIHKLARELVQFPFRLLTPHA